MRSTCHVHSRNEFILWVAWGISSCTAWSRYNYYFRGILWVSLQQSDHFKLFKVFISFPLSFCCKVAPTVCILILPKGLKSTERKRKFFFLLWSEKWSSNQHLQAQRIIVVHIFPRITVTSLFLLDNHGITHTVHDYSGWQVNVEVIAIHILIPHSHIWELSGSSHHPSLLSLPLASFYSRLFSLPCRSAAQQVHSPSPSARPPPRLTLGSATQCLNDAQGREWFQREAMSPSRLVNVFNHRFKVLQSAWWQYWSWIKGKLCSYIKLLAGSKACGRGRKNKCISQALISFQGFCFNDCKMIITLW